MRLYHLYIAMRLRGYVHASGQLLLRHWQWLLIASLAVPGLPILPLLTWPSTALSRLASGRLPLTSTIAGLVAIQITAVLWVALQRDSLRSGSMSAYAAALPISPLVQRGTTLTVLLVADLLLLLPFVAALAAAIAGQRGYEVLALITILAAALALQAAFIDRRTGAIVAVPVADVALVLALVEPVARFAPALLGLALILAAAALVASPRRSFRKSSTPTRVGRKAVLVPLSPALRIQLKALAERPAATTMRLLLAMGLALGTDQLVMAARFDPRVLPGMIVAMAAIALVISGLYRSLRDAHAPVAPLLATLPLSRGFWLVRDVALIVLLGAVPFLLLAVPLELSAPLVVLPSLAAAYFVLLALLRLPLAWGGRLGAILAMLIATGWAGTAIAAVAR